MEFNTALYNYLTSYSELSSLVGDRIYPDELQDPIYPAIVYTLTDEDEVATFHTPDSNLISSTYEFECHASTRAGAEVVAKQLRLAFKNYSGVMGGDGGVTVEAVIKLDRDSDTAYDGSGKVIARISIIDFKFWYQE